MRSSLLAPRGFEDGTKASPRPARAVMEATRLSQADPGSQPHTVQLRLGPNLCIGIGETGTEATHRGHLRAFREVCPARARPREAP